MRDTAKIRDFPLHVFGDKIIDVAEKMGIKGACVVIVLATSENGEALSTSNLTEEATVALLKFVVASHADATVVNREIIDKEKRH